MTPEIPDFLKNGDPLEKINPELRRKALDEIEKSGMAAKYGSDARTVLHAGMKNAIEALNVPLDPHRPDESVESQKTSKDDLAMRYITAGGVTDETAKEIVVELISSLGLISRTLQ